MRYEYYFIFLLLTGCGQDIPDKEIQTEPIQKNIEQSSFEIDNFKITKVAEYEIDAKILSKKEYDDILKISPIDLALGWKTMSNNLYLKQINFWQSNRWYIYQTKIKMDMNEISYNSANTHIIPANIEIKNKLLKFKTMDEIHLKGFLVNVESKDGLAFFTSTSRKDTGGGSCEILYVEEVY